MRAAALSRARRVFSRSADRAALLAPPLPAELICASRRMRRRCTARCLRPLPPSPRPPFSCAQRLTALAGGPRYLLPKRLHAPARVCTKRPMARGPDALLGCGEKSKLLAARTSWRVARSAGRGARRSPHAHSRAARCSSPLVCACINCCTSRCSSARGTRLLPCLEMDYRNDRSIEGGGGSSHYIHV